MFVHFFFWFFLVFFGVMVQNHDSGMAIACQ
jgi:hypothetical protein